MKLVRYGLELENDKTIEHFKFRYYVQLKRIVRL